MTEHRIEAFRGALAALGEGVTTVDEHTLAIGNATLAFDGERIVVRAEQRDDVADRIARLGSIFRIAVVTPDGVPIAIPKPEHEREAPAGTATAMHAPHTIVDDIIEQAPLIERATPTSGLIGIPDVEAGLSLVAAIVRVRFYSVPPEFVRVKLGGALVQVLRITDEAYVGTRVTLPRRAPEWFDRTLATLGWRIQGSAGVEYARPPANKRQK